MNEILSNPTLLLSIASFLVVLLIILVINRRIKKQAPKRMASRIRKLANIANKKQYGELNIELNKLAEQIETTGTISNE